jgi:hypothetical protein
VDVQWPHFLAATGIGIKHCGQSLVVGAATGAGLISQRFTTRNNRKIANAMIRKVKMAFRNNP